MILEQNILLHIIYLVPKAYILKQNVYYTLNQPINQIIPQIKKKALNYNLTLNNGPFVIYNSNIQFIIVISYLKL